MTVNPKSLVLQINGAEVEATPCRKHEHYVAEGYLVVSCKKCVIRRINGVGVDAKRLDVVAGEGLVS